MPEDKPAPLSRSLAARAASLLRVRWVVRFPVVLYRARLGFLFGSRMLMLEHIGRKTGARRYAVLEVVDRPRPGTYVVVSGFGTRAQWFRNVRACPNVGVWVGPHGRAPATARLLTSDEVRTALASYADKHPRAWATLRPVFEETLGVPITDREASLPMVALDLGSPAAPVS
jgi:deazaflavin-dependent oxidoreductase (nitroreductase family)